MNVGVIDGGLRSNVVAPVARAFVDVRVETARDAARIEWAITTIRPVTPGTEHEITGGIRRKPLERTPRNRALYRAIQAAGKDLGLEIDETSVGGMSDGNTASHYAATVDGLGPIGDGAHAPHEHVLLDGLVERTALLAAILLLPVTAVTEESEESDHSEQAGARAVEVAEGLEIHDEASRSEP